MTHEERARAWLDKWTANASEWFGTDERASLAAEFAAVRREALEEAADACDVEASGYATHDYAGVAKFCGDRIRAMETQ